MKTFVTSSAVSMVEPHFAAIRMVFSGLMTQKSHPVLMRQYARVGRLDIRIVSPSTHMEDTLMLRNTLICLCIFRRFINTLNSVNDANSPNRRLSGLCQFWMKKYDSYTIDSLLKELFGTLHLQDSMLFLLPNLLTGNLSNTFRISSTKRLGDPIAGHLLNVCLCLSLLCS